MAEAEVTVRDRRSLSAVWLVPLVALLLGVWMVIHTLRSQGPEITIVFSSGAGIEADKTQIKVRAVEVGLVESVGLAEDLESVVVTARLDKPAAPLLREDTQFWMVIPRVGPGGVSGLGTLLSGGYIQLAPGTGPEGRRRFEALDAPPITPTGTPGLHFRLEGERAGSVGGGDPILYRGFRVGRVESAEFDLASQKMHYGGFIEAPYDDLVTSTTRFWNASGLSVSASADGIDVHTASLEALLLGGVAFGLPEGVEPGTPIEAGVAFELYPDYASVNERPYRHSLEYIVRFPQSVRGLQPGAPVEYRGIRLGRVERVLMTEMVSQELRGEGSAIPVQIRVEPGRVGLPDSEAGAKAMSNVVVTGVGNGLRASLATGSLITGSLFVYFDYYPAAPPETMGTFAGVPTIPSIGSGLAGIETRVATLLDKLNHLPLEGLLDGLDRLLSDVNAIVASEGIRSLPASLDATLADLRETLDSVSADSALQEQLLRTIGEFDRTLQNLGDLLETLEEQPNALIFSREPGVDPLPPAGSR